MSDRLRQLQEKYRPHFEKIAEGASERDATRALPYELIKQLIADGFGAVRVPVEYGGAGATLPELFELLTDLATADSNITQALRAHFAFVEDRLVAEPGPTRDAWLRRFVDGDLVGNAWTEIGDVALGETATKVSPTDDPEVFRVNGQKYYSTGSIFADWTDTTAQRTDTGDQVIAVVSTHQDAVARFDDWDGFGQRTTGTGTTIFTDAEVSAENVILFSTRFKYQTAFYQVVLLSVLAGTAAAAEKDFGATLAARHRTFSHGNGPAPQDPQLLQVIGEVSSAAFAARATVYRTAQALQEAYEAAFALRDGTLTLDEEERVNDHTELASAQGQVALTGFVTNAISHAFDALAASSSSTSKNLDRHWRNARTAGSHNPWVFKAKQIGDFATNGHVPSRIWAVGSTK